MAAAALQRNIGSAALLNITMRCAPSIVTMPSIAESNSAMSRASLCAGPGRGAGEGTDGPAVGGRNSRAGIGAETAGEPSIVVSKRLLLIGVTDTFPCENAAVLCFENTSQRTFPHLLKTLIRR